jgi:hypothetical protein
VRIAALILLLLLGGLGSAGSWGALWLLVPVSVATALLLAWRFGLAALVLPVLLGLAAAGFAIASTPGLSIWSTVWLPLGAAIGVWMGLHEEGGGPGIGARAWMLSPLLVAAALLPVLPGFEPAVGRFDHVLRDQQEALLKAPDAAGLPKVWREALQEKLKSSPVERRRELLFVVPNALFLWSVLLVAAGRALAARLATVLGWPELSRSPLRAWRLPDATLTLLLLGLGLVVFADRAWQPGAWTLLVHAALGYSVQGIAVVESVLLSRGIPPVFVTLTLVFVIAVSLLWVLPVVALVGLSDVWLDYRRLEPSPAGEA